MRGTPEPNWTKVGLGHPLLDLSREKSHAMDDVHLQFRHPKIGRRHIHMEDLADSATALARMDVNGCEQH